MKGTHNLLVDSAGVAFRFTEACNIDRQGWGDVAVDGHEAHFFILSSLISGVLKVVAYLDNPVSWHAAALEANKFQPGVTARMRIWMAQGCTTFRPHRHRA